MQLRFLASLTLLISCNIVFAAQTSPSSEQKPSETKPTAHQLFMEDQEDGRGGPNGGPRFTEEEYHRRVTVRQTTLRAMLANGELKTGEDFMDASFVFQHGDKADDFLFAHILAMEALARGMTSARFIAAATLDRYLQFTKQPQVFGTQYVLDRTVPLTVHTSGLPLPFGRTLEPYNQSFLSDSVRTDFCVPVLAQQKENVVLFNAGKWPRETMHPRCP